MTTFSTDLGHTGASDGLLCFEAGDRLSRDEFERRYNAMPDLKKAELIEGVVYMPAAVRYRQHGYPHTLLVAWVANYDAATFGACAADNTSIRLDLKNMPQPDVALFVDHDCGGQVTISDDDYVEGAPEFVAEVTSSSVSYDLGDKLTAYCRNGVREYLVWRVLDREFDWFVLRDGEYQPMPKSDDGILRSEVFPGLWLDATAMLESRLKDALATLDLGLETEEHKTFVERLKANAS